MNVFRNRLTGSVYTVKTAAMCAQYDADPRFERAAYAAPQRDKPVKKTTRRKKA